MLLIVSFIRISRQDLSIVDEELRNKSDSKSKLRRFFLRISAVWPNPVRKRDFRLNSFHRLRHVLKSLQRKSLPRVFLFLHNKLSELLSKEEGITCWEIRGQIAHCFLRERWNHETGHGKVLILWLLLNRHTNNRDFLWGRWETESSFLVWELSHFTTLSSHQAKGQCWYCVSNPSQQSQDDRVYSFPRWTFKTVLGPH